MSEIGQLRKQFSEGKWKKFIKSITITNLRGWTGQTIQFRFPVCAIVGENGIGKSTFLRAAACVYDNISGKSFYPSNLFIKTQWDDTSVNGATIDYSILEGDNTRPIKWKKANDWGYTPKSKSKKPKRHVFFLDISRTLPLDATAGYAKVAKLSSEERGVNVELSEENLQQLSYIMGKEYRAARFTNTNIYEQREVGLLRRDFGEVSQFHQGAGEDTMLDMFKVFQDIPEQSLLIIDEVEASLHPLAQRRFAKYLLHLARTKKIQIILSTHSPYILEELPDEARIMLMQLSDKKEIVNNVSVNFALSTIDDCNHPELYIYVEDEEAEKLLVEIVKSDTNQEEHLLQKIAVKAVGSSDVVVILHDVSEQNKLPNKGLAIIDGDKKEEHPRCFALPGDLAPEKMVILDLREKNWNNLDNRFGIGSGTLYKILNDSMLLPDHHEWTTYIGDKIKQSKDYVWSILIEEWCKQCLSIEVRDLVLAKILEKIH